MNDDLVKHLIARREKDNASPTGCLKSMPQHGHPYPCCEDCPCALRNRVISDAARIEALTAENAKLREALQEQVAFLAMDLTTLRGFADPDKIADLEYRRDRARAALAKWGA